MAGGEYRQENDGYYTPLEAITSFLDLEQFQGLTWEPAEGDKRIVQALKQIGCKVIGSDLATGTDFLQTKRKVDNVVTNPPWSKKERVHPSCEAGRTAKGGHVATALGFVGRGAKAIV